MLAGVREVPCPAVLFLIPLLCVKHKVCQTLPSSVAAALCCDENSVISYNCVQLFQKTGRQKNFSRSPASCQSCPCVRIRQGARRQPGHFLDTWADASSRCLAGTHAHREYKTDVISNTCSDEAFTEQSCCGGRGRARRLYKICPGQLAAPLPGCPRHCPSACHLSASRQPFPMRLSVSCRADARLSPWRTPVRKTCTRSWPSPEKLPRVLSSWQAFAVSAS